MVVSGQFLQYILSVGTWSFPENKMVNWADRACAVTNMSGLFRTYLERTTVPVSYMVLGMTFALSMKAMDFRYARKNEVTNWYIAWHVSILLGNVLIVLGF